MALLRAVRRRVACLILAASIAMAGLLPAQAAAQWRGARALEVTFDVLVLRPVAVAKSAVGAGLFVPAALLASPGGRDPILEAWDVFVAQPAESAYTRPLGEF